MRRFILSLTVALAVAAPCRAWAEQQWQTMAKPRPAEATTPGAKPKAEKPKKREIPPKTAKPRKETTEKAEQKKIEHAAAGVGSGIGSH